MTGRSWHILYRQPEWDCIHLRAIMQINSYATCRSTRPLLFLRRSPTAASGSDVDWKRRHGLGGRDCFRAGSTVGFPTIGVDFSNDFSLLTSFHMTSTAQIQEADTYIRQPPPMTSRIVGDHKIDLLTILTISSIASATSENVQVSSPSCLGCSEASSRTRLARRAVLAATLRYASRIDFT